MHFLGYCTSPIIAISSIYLSYTVVSEEKQEKWYTKYACIYGIPHYPRRRCVLSTERQKETLKYLKNIMAQYQRLNRMPKLLIWLIKTHTYPPQQRFWTLQDFNSNNKQRSTKNPYNHPRKFEISTNLKNVSIETNKKLTGKIFLYSNNVQSLDLCGLVCTYTENDSKLCIITQRMPQMMINKDHHVMDMHFYRGIAEKGKIERRNTPQCTWMYIYIYIQDEQIK